MRPPGPFEDFFSCNQNHVSVTKQTAVVSYVCFERQKIFKGLERLQ